MKTATTDSMFPCGFGASIVLTLAISAGGGALTGLLVSTIGLPVQNGGGVILLFIIVGVVVGPWLYNRIASAFEKERRVRGTVDDFGTILCLRGAFIRMLLYDDGLEIRAFYHRFFIAFTDIIDIAIVEGRLAHTLTLTTTLKSLPGSVVCHSHDFLDLARDLERRIKSLKAQ